jgi:release factor glutamine methyltransferase
MEALKQGKRLLQGLDNPQQEAQWILCHVLRKNTSYLLAQGDTEITASQAKIFYSLIERRAKGEPFAYLTGVQGFYDHMLTVTPDTLIPRPETELMVDTLLSLFKDDPLRVLEIGTGSGAIAITLAAQRPQWSITATDICPKALAVAKHNAKQNHLNTITFMLADVFTGLSDQKPFDIIISNPPYIDEADEDLEASVRRYEPTLALIAPDQGLGIIKRIIRESAQYATTGAMLMLEHGYQQSASVQAIFLQAGYQKVTTLQDMNGHERMTFGIVPSS